jgi:hypothetical protein
MLYGRLAKYPRIHAAFQVLAGLGFDVPKVADGLSRMLSGNTVDQAKVRAVELAVEALIPVHVQPTEPPAVPPALLENIVQAAQALPIPPEIPKDLLETMKARVALEKAAK